MADPRFFADIEGAPWSDVLRLKQEKLRAQLAYVAARSVFYQKKFAAAGVDPARIERLEDLDTLPFTEKSELRASLEQTPLGHHRAAPLDRIVQIQASSGTTGSPAYVGLTRHDQFVWQEMGARCLYAHGIRPGDLAMHGFSVSRGFVGGLPMSQIVLHLGAVEIPIGADAGTERILRVTRDLRPRVLLGTPYFAIHLEQAPRLVDADARELGVRIVSVGGEPGGGIPSVRQKIQSLWDADCRELCGGTDLGVAYWAECERKTGMHETAQEFIYIELIDPDTGAVQPWKEGATGELVYTALDRECSPLVRFRTRDHAVVTGTGPCDCGRTAPMIRVFGRTDDMLIVKGINVFPSAIRDVVAGFEPRTTGNLRVIADFAGHTTQRPLRIKVEHGPALAGRGGEIERLRQEVAERLRGLLNFAPAVEMVPPDTFEKPGVQKIALIVREQPGT
jgi:phenylacetate-CoA ligase